jgi:hypothetical protein
MTFVARACSKRIPQAEAPKMCSSDFKFAILLRSLTQRSSLPLTHAAHALALAFATSRLPLPLRWGWSWHALSAGFSACTSPFQVMHPSTHIRSSIAEDCPCLVSKVDLVSKVRHGCILPMTFAQKWFCSQVFVCVPTHPPSLCTHLPTPIPHTHTHANVGVNVRRSRMQNKMNNNNKQIRFESVRGQHTKQWHTCAPWESRSRL